MERKVKDFDLLDQASIIVINYMLLFISLQIILIVPLVYEVYRGFIVFVFSVTMFVGVCV